LADTAIAITAGSGTNVDTRTEATNGNHRQVVVVGDPSTNAGVAPVDATNGLSVTLTTAIPAGSAAIGKLAANSGVDIGDVDVASIAAGTNVIGKIRLVDSAGDECTDSTANAAKVLLVNAAGTALTADTQATHDTALGTMTSVTGSLGFGRASAAVPSDVSADDDSAIAWFLRNGAVVVSPVPHTVGGLSTFMASGSDGSSILVATAQAIKATAGQLYGYYIYNVEAAVMYVHFYNTAAASVTVGTTNPMFTVAVPAGAAANLSLTHGIAFSNAGWSCAATTTAGGNTAPTTGVSLVAWYK
jgi:hypothetical protein